MRLNGTGALTFEDARTWLEETGLCLFLPRRQYPASLAPSFVEAVGGRPDLNPDPKQIAHSEELLVRMEQSDIAVRLNLLGQPGEQPDFIVAAWVLPYVYALRGDRDWRRTPQLTGSRQVSPLAIQAYKLLEASEMNIPQLTHALGREVTEQGVTRAITELWQQLRIIPVVAAPGQTPKWQLLKVRYQKAIAEGASTSQVTAISVLASIYLQAVIAAGMEDVELFLAPLTARSKVREVLRGLVATRQVHTLSLGHAPHYYVAGTLPEFAQPATAYASSAISASSYFLYRQERDEEPESASMSLSVSAQAESPAPVPGPQSGEDVVAEEVAAERSPMSRPAARARDRKPAQSPGGRSTRYAGGGQRHAKRSGKPGAAAASLRNRATGGARSSHSAAGGPNALKAVSAARSARAAGKPGVQPTAANHSKRTQPVAAGAKHGNGERFRFSAARSRSGEKKRG